MVRCHHPRKRMTPRPFDLAHCPGVLDAPLEPVIGLAEGETRWPSLWPPHFGQIYPVPAGDLKQPTDSGITCFGSHSTTLGK